MCQSGLKLFIFNLFKKIFDDVMTSSNSKQKILRKDKNKQMIVKFVRSALQMEKSGRESCPSQYSKTLLK